MTQTMENMIAQYQVELDDYKLRFFTKWGYKPMSPNHSDFRFLSDKKAKMCGAFWNHTDVKRCTALIELYSMVLTDCRLRAH
jgi:hypothetical protein